MAPNNNCCFVGKYWYFVRSSKQYNNVVREAALARQRDLYPFEASQKIKASMIMDCLFLLPVATCEDNMQKEGKEGVMLAVMNYLIREQEICFPRYRRPSGFQTGAIRGSYQAGSPVRIPTPLSHAIASQG